MLHEILESIGESETLVESKETQNNFTSGFRSLKDLGDYVRELKDGTVVDAEMRKNLLALVDQADQRLTWAVNGIRKDMEDMVKDFQPGKM